MPDFVDMTTQEFDKLIEDLVDLSCQTLMRKTDLYFIDEMLVRAIEPTASDKQRAIAIRNRYE